MTQLTFSAEPFLRPGPAASAADDGQLARLMDRVRAAGRRLDLVDFGVTLWLVLWASCVGASLILLTGH